MINRINIGIVVDLYPCGIWHETGISCTQTYTIASKTTAITCNLKNSKVQVAKNILICICVTTNSHQTSIIYFNTSPTQTI
ncbi:MAG: hypothetical protein EXS07_04510 [Gemmataceae bacterium]|nr:hypothetical protein [Gemmataceae bacterium]